MKTFPIPLIQSIFIFGAFFVWSCSPNTTLSTNPCSLYSDCGGLVHNQYRTVYFEIEVNPPLPVIPTGGGLAAGNIQFSGIFNWNAQQNSYPLSTVTTECRPLDVNIQHPIFVYLAYEHPYDPNDPNLAYPNFTPWIGQCHSVEIKAFDINGSLLQSWFEPSVGHFATGWNSTGGQILYDFNNCGGPTGYHQFGTLILPPCP